MVFGSMVTGDLWEESDIDLFVVLNKNMDEIKNIYTEEKGIAVHIKLMSKEKFIQLFLPKKAYHQSYLLHQNLDFLNIVLLGHCVHQNGKP